jgi:hypothetical protein
VANVGAAAREHQSGGAIMQLRRVLPRTGHDAGDLLARGQNPGTKASVNEDERALKRKRDHQKEMTLGAMGISVPVFAIAAIVTGLAGVTAVCVMLAVIAIVSTR